MTDINMPGMDGLTFLKHVGEVDPILKVIMVSAYSDMTNIREAMNRGAFDFLVKPIDFKDLEITIEKTLKHVRDLKKTLRSTEENSILRMFVSNGIVERLLPMIRDTDVLPNEMVTGTVAFIGVGGGSAASSGKLSPDAVVRRLNANFEVIVPEITAKGGVVDKFVGSAVMAGFRGKDHAARAIDACLAVKAQLAVMAERSGPGSPYADSVRAGIESGDLVSGSFGSKALSRLDFSVVGDALTVASHLESSAAPGQILVGDLTYSIVHKVFDCERLGLREIPGIVPPKANYAVVKRTEGSENPDIPSTEPPDPDSA